MSPDPDSNSDPGGLEPLDEVGVRLGPDRDGEGLFDPPRENSMVGEKTSVTTDESPIREPERALLDWIAGDSLLLANVPEQAEPCRPLRQRIADEPPDLLPSLAAPALLHRASSRVLRAPPSAPARAPEADDTATQIRPMPRTATDDDPPTNEHTSPGDRDTENTQSGQTGSWIVASDEVLRTARWLALALLTLSATAWWFLGR